MLDQVADATVKLTKLGGQGVVVPGNIILTAAHCVAFTVEGAMVLGDYFFEPIQSGDKECLVSPWFLDPMSDIAALGSPDNQECSDEADKYLEFLESVRPVPICTVEYELFTPFSVWIRSHKRSWIEAKAQLCREGAQALAIQAKGKVEGGTSGGPIVNESGELVGVVSIISENEDADGCSGSCSRPHRTLGPWVLDEIFGRNTPGGRSDGKFN